RGLCRRLLSRADRLWREEGRRGVAAHLAAEELTAAMLYLLGGFAILGGLLLLVYLFVNADPARLARGLKVSGIVVAIAAVATLAISGRLAALLVPVAMLMPLLVRVRALLDRYRTPAGGQTSTVATPFLRMTLDHDTGSVTGTILRGRFSGMRV